MWLPCSREHRAEKAAAREVHRTEAAPGTPRLGTHRRLSSADAAEWQPVPADPLVLGTVVMPRESRSEIHRAPNHGTP